MKILIATGIYPPDIGGPATYVKTLKEELPKQGIKVTVVTYGEVDVLDVKNEIFRISRRQHILFRYLNFFRYIFRLCREVDLVYIQDAVSVGLPVCVACILRGKKYILRLAGDHAWEQGCQRFGIKDNLDEFQKKRYGWQVELLRIIERWVARNAYLIITPSKYLMGIAKAWGVEEDKVRVIYNSVKGNSIQSSKEVLRKKLNLDGYVLLSAGRLVPWKGYLLLVDIMPELLEISSDFRLIIIGDGPEKCRLQAEIKNRKLEKSVVMTGALAQSTLWEYMAAADAFVFNTGYEGLPHMTIEAMQHNLPVITTSVGGNMEVVQNEFNGILVNYNDKPAIYKSILRIYNDRVYAKKLAEQAKLDISERFSQKRMIEGVLQILKSGLLL